MSKKRTTAVCGLICCKCLIHLAPNDPKIARKLAEGFKGKWENVKLEDFSCDGCWEEDDNMWSPNCEIRKCCIKDKNQGYCYECQMFVCVRIGQNKN